MSAVDQCPLTLSFFEGSSTVAVMEVYSDASEIRGHFALGSLLFRKKNLKPFNKKWGAMLRKFQIPHFHMTDCNVGEGVFKGKDDAECDACAREAISILIEFATKGAIFSVKESDFYGVIGVNGVMPNPFTLGGWFTLFDIRRWADEHDQAARISYVFEAGDDHQKDANALFRAVRDNPHRKAAFRYRNHAFVPKEICYAAQAADILAWHGAKHRHRRERDREKFRLRGDFNEIVTRLHVTDGHHEREWLEQIVAIAQRDSGGLGNELAGLAFKMHNANANEIAKKVAALLANNPEAIEGFAARAGVALARSA